MSKPSKHSTAKADTPKRKTGAPFGNTNGFRHGLKASRLPRECRYIELRMNDFRRHVEDLVMAAKGEINLADAACIQTALRWERHAALAQRWLTKQYNELKPADRLTFSREIARASAERDRAIAALQLGRKKVLDLTSYLASNESNSQ